MDCIEIIFLFVLFALPVYFKVLEIVRAADAFTSVPPKSPSEHHDQDKIQKTTTVVISKHTLDTNPAVQPAASAGSAPSPTSPSATGTSPQLSTATPSPASQPQSPQVCNPVI